MEGKRFKTETYLEKRYRIIRHISEVTANLEACQTKIADFLAIGGAREK